MPAPASPDPAVLTPGEVMTLFRIGRTTLHEWRTQGRLQGVRAHARAHWRYPVAQPAIRDALAAAGGVR